MNGLPPSRKTCSPLTPKVLGGAYFESQLEDFDRPPDKPSIARYDDGEDSDLGYLSGEEVEVEVGGFTENGDAFETEPMSAHDTYSVHSSRPPFYKKWEDEDSDPEIEAAESNTFEDESDEERWVSSLSYRKHCRHHNRFGKVVPIEDAAYVT